MHFLLVHDNFSLQQFPNFLQATIYTLIYIVKIHVLIYYIIIRTKKHVTTSFLRNIVPDFVIIFIHIQLVVTILVSIQSYYTNFIRNNLRINTYPRTRISTSSHKNIIIFLFTNFNNRIIYFKEGTPRIFTTRSALIVTLGPIINHLNVIVEQQRRYRMHVERSAEVGTKACAGQNTGRNQRSSRSMMNHDS